MARTTGSYREITRRRRGGAYAYDAYLQVVAEDTVIAR
jgi:hypothetical protein